METVSISDLGGKTKYFATMKMEVVISKRTHRLIFQKAKRLGINLWGQRHYPRAMAKLLFDIHPELITATLHHFTDAELGIVKKKMPTSKYPIQKLKPAQKIDGVWQGDCIVLNNNQYDWCFRYWKKYHPGLKLVFRRLSDDTMGVWRVDSNEKIDVAFKWNKRTTKAAIQHKAIPTNEKYSHMAAN